MYSELNLCFYHLIDMYFSLNSLNLSVHNYIVEGHIAYEGRRSYSL